jgi:hypothetical protein
MQGLLSRLIMRVLGERIKTLSDDGKKPVVLVCMRLDDMHVVHPDQTEALCSECQHMVGVYPTGQRALREYSEIAVVCQRCASDGVMDSDDIFSAGTRDEILKERDESKAVGKA